MRVKTFAGGAVLWLALVGSAHAVQTSVVEHWLQRLQDAQGAQDYQGAFVYERKGNFSTHQVWRQMNTQGQLLERFIQLNGPYYEVMRTDGHVSCISAGSAAERAAVDVLPAAAFKLSNVQQWYDVHVLGKTRVAGQMTSVLLFSPRDQHRYALELYVDEESAVPLKTLLLNEQGQLLERLEFVQFQAHTAQDASISERSADLTPSAKCLPIIQTKHLDAEKAAVGWTVGWTPPGFELLKSDYKKSVASANYVLSQLYSDGIVHFSVFFEDVENLDVQGGRRQLGPTAVVSRKISQENGSVMVTVVGEIPLGSAERVALSMRVEQDQLDD